jgi:hypothetical protein
LLCHGEKEFFIGRMKEKKQLKEDEKVKEIITKNQEVIDALKKLSYNITPDSSDHINEIAYEYDKDQAVG